MEILLKDTCLIIPEHIIKVLSRFCQTSSFHNESGGILLGKKELNKSRYIISAISKPSEKDKATCTSFVRSKETGQEIINEYWKHSKGVVNYLGEWHTHPEKRPTPSPTDLRLLKTLLEDGSNVFPELFMIIVGQTYFFIGKVSSRSPFSIESQYIKRDA